MYNFLTFAQAVTALAGRLQDPSQIYWNQPSQLLNCLIESLRLFQALTGSYKQQVTFPTSAGVQYYDLPTLTSAGAISYNATDVEVINNVLACLLEPPITFPVWTGTGQFTLAQLQAAMQSRLNRFLGETGCRVVQQTIGSVGEINPLPDPVLDVRRVGWIPLPGSSNPPFPTFPLGRMDEWGEQAYLPSAAQQPDQPVSYSVFGVAPLQLRLIPPPSTVGNIDLLLVQAGPALTLNPSSPVVLQLPDDLSPAIKWGVLADLLGTDGPSRDYARAQYAEQRYQEYVQLARIYPSVLTATINNLTVGEGSVFDLDAYQPDWGQVLETIPSFVGMCGLNLACVGPPPDDGTAGGNPGNNYGVSLWMCANAPVLGQTFLQVSRDQIDPILDYAQHIASFQMGGAEFEGTARLYQNLIACAKAQNGRLEAVSFYKSQLQQPAMKSEMENARMIA